MKARINLKPEFFQKNYNNNYLQWKLDDNREKNRFIFASTFYRDNRKKFQLFLSMIMLCFILPNSASAHRGARNEVDMCRISVGSEVIHFSAYTPSLSGGKSYCQIIPDVGLTHLVFDYEGKKLRHTTVEFEITKEPEATRVFYQKPEIIVKGTVDAKVDFTKYGAGNYLAHITIMNQGEKLDSHLPFSVGMESDGGMPIMLIILLSVIFVIVAAMFIVSKTKKGSAT